MAEAAQGSLQRDPAFLAFAVDLLPLAEVLPGGGQAADHCLAAIREQDQGVVPEQVREGVLVVPQVVGVGVFQADVGGLELDQHQGQAVDKPHQVRAAGVKLAGDPELGGQEIVVAGRIVPIDHLDRLGFFDPVLIPEGDFDPVLEQVVHSLVDVSGTHEAAVAAAILRWRVDRLQGADRD